MARGEKHLWTTAESARQADRQQNEEENPYQLNATFLGENMNEPHWHRIPRRDLGCINRLTDASTRMLKSTIRIIPD